MNDFTVSNQIPANKQIEGWNAKEWRARFDEAKRYRQTHSVRAEVFQSTVSIVQAGTYISQNKKVVGLSNYLNPNCITDNVFYNREFATPENSQDNDTTYNVVKEDCLAYAKQLFDKDAIDDLCVLNMASASNPGGGVYGGAGAQEEYLFRCSDYYRFLFQYAISFDCMQYGIPPCSQYRYPLDRNFGGIFSHGVTIFRGTETCGYPLIDIPWQVNFIAVAACNLSYDERGEQIPSHLIETTENKIRTILRIAIDNNQKRLVLGAFGCGAFGNPPKHIAELFFKILHEADFLNRFKSVDFAILPDHNDHKGNFEAFATQFVK